MQLAAQKRHILHLQYPSGFSPATLLPDLPELLAHNAALPYLQQISGPLAFLVLQFHVFSSFEEALHFGRIALEGRSVQSGAT